MAKKKLEKVEKSVSEETGLKESEVKRVFESNNRAAKIQMLNSGNMPKAMIEEVYWDAMGRGDFILARAARVALSKKVTGEEKAVPVKAEATKS